MRNKSRASMKAIQGVCFGLIVSLGACTAKYNNHGYIPPQEDLDQITIGVDTRDSVAQKVGTPASAGLLTNSGYYYVRSRQRSIGPLATREIDRQVLAISFSEKGIVQNVERFGLEKGQVVPLERRVTSSAVSNKTFLRQLLGNIGRIAPSGFN
ncbi:MAG: outer membrane protein assembly factor BamE (lipoprotein component of BamABCDE complex) [Sulfitobacter sp.]|jgi:outer membrane protein assembly factor BamE (lipoprotein component of BamABCDE complex)